MGVILISEDLEEVTNLSDRIAVFFEGQVMRVLPSEEADESTLDMLMAGMKEAAC